MALASTDPKVLMGQAKCFACLTPHEQLVDQTYLLAVIAGLSTTAAGVQSLSAQATCFSCLTRVQLARMRQYLLAAWLGIDTSLAGIQALVQAAKCVPCLTPKQQQTLDTYLFATSAHLATDVSGVRAINAAAKCFRCLDTKQQYEVQVYILAGLSGVTFTTPADLMVPAKCFEACLPFELQEVVQTSLITQAANKLTSPCITPTAPFVFTPLVIQGSTTSLGINWKPLTNTGSLITGYIVYWGTVQGGPYTNNSGVVSVLNRPYIVTGLSSGTTYYFVVVAQTSIPGCVSANSNEVSGTTTGSAPFGLLVGLAAYWKLDEAAGAVRVDSVGLNNASQGADTIAQSTNAIIGDSANFSGTSTGLQITSNSQLQFGAGVSKSFSGWIFPSSLVVEQVILGKWNDTGADREYLLEVAVGGAVNFLARKLDDSATVTVTSAITLAANTWYHVAFGYDDGTNTIWIQVDGETRVTAACTGVRSSNVQFRFGSCVNKSIINQGPWSGLLDEFAMWTRALTSSEVVQLSASYGLAGLQAMNSVGTDNANRWNTKVQSNGGAALSAATVSSFASCVDGLVTDGIYNRIFQINPIAPDSLIAVETPWSRKGNTLTQWTNHNFVIGDLGINGLTGDGATKYLDTGFNASTQIPSQNNASLAFYAYTANSTANGVECGCLNGAVTTGYYLRSNLPATSATVISDVAAEPTVASPGNGYYCGSRTASNRVDIYFANSLTPHASVANSVVAATLAFPNFVQPLFADNFNGAVSSFVNSVLSSSVFALGLSSSQSQSLFNRLQAMLVARGGGFR